VFVGEWSGRQWSCATFIHWRLVASSLVIGQWRSRVSRWQMEWSRSTADQWTTTTTRPHWQKLSSQAVGTWTIMLQRTHVTTLHCTQQQWGVVVSAHWRHLNVSSAMTSDCDSSLLTTLTLTLCNKRQGMNNFRPISSLASPARAGTSYEAVSPTVA